VNARLEAGNLHGAIAHQDEVSGPADKEVAARGPKTSLSRQPNSAQPVSRGIPSSKTDWPKPSALTNRFSSWPSPHNAAEFQVFSDLATPTRRTVSSAIQKSSKPPVILSASESTLMRVKKLKKLFAATSMVASKTPPFAFSLPMENKSSQEVAVAPTRSSEAISYQPLEKSLMTIEPKEKAKPQQFRIFQTSASDSMSPQPIKESSS
tara:strand:+ start:886 stop:1509 length:624 start_codon:yes stop_codon:yes gene_type:complete